MAQESPRPVNGAIDEGWHAARLIPTTGIRGQEEQEKRATACLLAVMRAVPEFGRSLVSDLGAPRGRISTFTEVRFRDGDGKVAIPDGVIVVEWGKITWRALVEVKTASAELADDQVSRYVDLARDQSFDAVVTISNQITASPRESPAKVSRGKLRRVDLRHLSWWGVITEAVLQHRHRGIADPDQAFILGELIAYLDDERSGASGFQDMGQQWVAVRESARNQTLRASDPDARAVAERWEQFVDYLCLGLGQDLGRDVEPVRSRNQSREERLAGLLRSLAEAGTLATSFRVPDAIAPVTIEADLRSRRVTTSVQVAAPEQMQARGRIGWILRQLKHGPPDLRVEVRFARSRETTATLLPVARENPKVLLSPADPTREPRAFELALSRPMGKKRGRGLGTFVGDTRQQAIEFYREIVQDLKPWRAPAPKLPEEPREVSETPQPEPPPFAAGTDSRELGEATSAEAASSEDSESRP